MYHHQNTQAAAANAANDTVALISLATSERQPSFVKSSLSNEPLEMTSAIAAAFAASLAEAENND